MDANKAVHYQTPVHVHAQGDVESLVADLTSKTSKVPSDPGQVHVTGTISPDATGWYRQNGTFGGNPAYERLGGGWWIRYDGLLPWYWRICEGAVLADATPRWTAGSSYQNPVAAPNEGSYSAMAGATGTATVALGAMASDFFASYDENGHLARTIPKSDVPIRADGTYMLWGKVQEGASTASGSYSHGEGTAVAVGSYCHAEGSISTASGANAHAEGNMTIAAGDNSHAEGSNSKCGYPGDACTINGTTITISGDARSRFASSENVIFWNLSGAAGSTAPQTRTITSTPAYADGNTTFSVGAALSPPHTAGKAASQFKGRYAHAEGISNTVLSDCGHVEGTGNSVGASAPSGHAEGAYNTANANFAHVEGYYSTASAQASHASGYYSSANKQYQRVLASGRFAATGDAQYTELVLRRATTDATPAELTIDGGAPSGTTENTSNRFILATGKTYACLIMIAARKSDGTSAFFIRQALIKSVSNTVSLEGSVQTVGVDINPAGWTVPAITADNTNKSLVITVTGVASTNIRWSATIQAQEILY